MLIEPLLSIFSSGTQSLQLDNNNSSDRNSLVFNSRQGTAEKNKKVKSTISPTTSLAMSLALKFVFILLLNKKIILRKYL